VAADATEQRRGSGGSSIRAAAWLAWMLCGVSLVLLGLTLVLVLLGSSGRLPAGLIPWEGQAIFAVGFIGTPILGALVVSRLPENPYGWVWLAFGLSFALFIFAHAYTAYAVANPGTLLAPGLARRVGTIGWVVSLVLLPFLLLLFPTGRPPTRRWRFLAWIVVASGVFVLVAGAFLPGQGGVGPVGESYGIGGSADGVVTRLTEAGVYVILVAGLLSVLSVVVRYRRAGGAERQQIKWFAYAAGIIAACVVFAGLLGLNLPGAWDALLETVPLIALYTAIGIAIMRYRLYDIDIVINRTLVYGSLTALLAALYFGGVAVTQVIFRALTGQEQQPQLAIVVSTLVIAALFNPLRHRIQAFIDQRFYRRKYDAAKTLEAFSAKLRDETNLDALSDDLVGVVKETMQPAHVSLWLRPDTPSTQNREVEH
jgi:hypothetical protein